MNIMPVSSSFIRTNNYTFNRNKETKNINFGWCFPHIKAMETLNSKFENAVQKALAEQRAEISSIGRKNNIKKTRYSLLDSTASKTAQLFSQYCNMQYTVAEMIPTYALRMNKSLLDGIADLEVMRDPVKTLIAINDVTKMKMNAGVDKNTGKVYTEEQLVKAKSGTQLYTVTLLLQQIKARVNMIDNPDTRREVTELSDIVKASVERIYGRNAYERIMALSNIEGEITTEQKKASVALISEFDSKAEELKLPQEFEQRLSRLIETENTRLGKTLEAEETKTGMDIGIKLSYHTHAAEGEHVHHHDHPHFMTEEEHMAYHRQEHAHHHVHDGVEGRDK